MITEASVKTHYFPIQVRRGRDTQANLASWPEGTSGRWSFIQPGPVAEPEIG